jgi:hypothetical protein
MGFGLSPTAYLTFHGMNNADIVVASWNSSVVTGERACIALEAHRTLAQNTVAWAHFMLLQVRHVV